MRGHGWALVIAGGLALAAPAATGAGGSRLPGDAELSLTGRPFAVTTNGASPDIAVDEEGSAHVVWNEIAPTGSADVLHYCKVLRRGSSCAVKKTFVPPDGEANFNRDFGQARVVVPSPDEVMVFTPRYPNTVTVDSSGNLGACPEPSNDPNEHCYTSGRKTYVYRSFDGGANFGEPRVFSHIAPSGDMAVLHPAGGTPVVALVTDTTTGGTFFAAAPTDGYQRRDINLGDEGDDRAFNGTIGVLEDDKAVVAFEDLSRNLYVRGHFDPSASLMDISTWGPSLAIEGSEPRLAGGPGGLYLLYKPRVGAADRPYTLRRLSSSGVVGPAVRISDTASDRHRDLFEDESGRVHAAWVRRGSTSEELRYRFSPDGESFSAPLTLAEEDSVNHVALGAADDGGGFAVYSSAFLSNGTITIVPFGSQTPRRLIDVSIAGVDVTQGIQTPLFPTRSPDPAKPAAFNYGGVKLASARTTVVRVYANSRRPLTGLAVPPMSLQRVRDGRPIGAPLLADRVPTALPVAAPSAIADAERFSTTTVYTFTMPWQWAQGSFDLQLEINPTSLFPVIPECRLCRRDNTFRLDGLAFQPTARVRFQPVAISVRGSTPRGYPDPNGLFRAARETIPLPFDLPDYRGTLDLTDISEAGQIEEENCFLGVFPCDTELRPITQAERIGLALDRLSDWAADKSANTFPIAAFRRGSTTLGAATRGGTLLFSGSQPQALVGDDRPLTSVAHEIGHGLGRVHAGLTCGSNDNGQVGEAWPPNDDGALDGRGLDLTKPSPYAVLDAGVSGGAATYFDFMSYCANTNETTSGGNVPDAWVSIRNWERYMTLNSPTARRRVGTVRPQVARVAAARPRRAATLRVVALVPVDGKPSMVNVAPDDGPATPVDGPYTFVTRDEAGEELATAGGVAQSQHVEGAPPITIVTGRVSAAGAASVELVADGTPVAQQLASKAAPKLGIISPRRGETVGRGGAATLRWKATDADGDPLKAIVEYSADDGRTFSTVAVGPNRNRLRLRSAELPASRRARVRVRVQDGFHEAVATSPRFTSLGAPPRVRISAPAPGTTTAAGAAISLRGDAFDDTGRALRGRALTWLVGKRVVARGALVSVPGLGAGKRKLVLRAQDRGGRTATTATTIRVVPRRPLFTVLKAPRSLSRKARRVVLTVGAAFESRLRAGRTRTTVGHRPKKVAVRLKPGRSLLRLVLTLSSGKLESQQILEIPRR